MQAVMLQEGDNIDYTPGSAVSAGNVVVMGTVPLVANLDIAANALGALAADGVFAVVKDTSTFTAGDSVYWNTTADPVGGVAGTGASTSTASGANLMGLAVADSATGAATVKVKMTAAKRTATLAGSLGADDITGTDATLTVSGLAAAQGGSIPIKGGTSSTSGNAGGAVSLTGGTAGVTGIGGAATIAGGVGGTTSGAGGALVSSGGAGGTAGTGAGGAVTTRGGASGTGATGNGGAWSGGGGAAASTNGTGGAATLSGGLATGTGVGGAVTIVTGASGGASGTAGALSIDTGSAAGGTGAAITIGGTNATAITMGKMPRIPTATVAAAGTSQGTATAVVEGFTLVTAADDTVGVVLPSAVAGMVCIIKSSVSNKILKVYPNTSDAINAIAANSAISLASGPTIAMFVAYDAITWYTLPLLPS